MKFPFWDNQAAPGALKGARRDEVLEELCDRKQSCLLATAYLSIETRILDKTEGELHLRATMSQESARHTLNQQPLRIRFPWALTFYSGQTRLLGYQQDAQHRLFRMAIPEVLEPDEQREAFRLERVGRCQGAISTEDGAILRVSLENLSRLGAGVFFLDHIPAEGFRIGRSVSLSLALEEGPELQTEARLVHGQGQYLGLKFTNLPEQAAALGEWMAPRIEEAKRLWENRSEIRARAVQAAKPKSAPAGILFLSRDENLAERIAEMLEGIHPLRTASPNLISFREALSDPPLLILVDTAEADLEERHRLRGLFEAVAPTCPILVLGRGGDPDRWRSLASEIKANLFIEWNPNQSVFFRRLAQGLIRRHWKGILEL